MITDKDIKNLNLEIGVWYELKSDGATIEVYRDGKFTKEVTIKPSIKVNKQRGIF